MATSIINDIFERFMTAKYGSSTIYQSRITNNSIMYMKIGNFCFVSGVAKAAVALAAGNAIVTGIPSASNNTCYPINIMESDGNDIYNGFVSQYGSLCVYSSIPKDTWISISGVYRCI